MNESRSDDGDMLRARGPAMKGFLDVVQTLGLCVVAGVLIYLLRLARAIDRGTEDLLTRPPDIDRVERRIAGFEASIDANGASIDRMIVVFLALQGLTCSRVLQVKYN